MLDLVNHNTDNVTKIKNNKTFWDQTFTNTFIFYNSKVHSQYKNLRNIMLCYQLYLKAVFVGEADLK